MENLRYLSILVNNTAGVLTRLSGLIARRGFNIDSLSVCATEDELLSRMTISMVATAKDLLQLIRQLEKQVEVVKVTELQEKEALLREMLIVKVAISPDFRSQIIEICSIFDAKTIDLTQDTMVLELTGNPQKIDAFISVLLPYKIIELARSGVSALHRGKTTIKELNTDTLQL